MSFHKNADLPLGLKHEDLPLWMRKNRREVDWPFLVMLVVALIAVWPLVVRPGLPYTPGLRVQVSRAVEMSESIQSGVFYPRWAADFNYGYGSPLWNYLAPLPHYLTGLYRVLIQVSPQNSVKAVLAFSLVTSGLALFSFVRRRWGDYASVLAAAVFLYSPQLVWVKPYLLGDLPGLLAVTCFLISLWAFDRLLAGEHVRGWEIIGAAWALAALWVSHTPLNLVLAGMLGGWLLWRMVLDAWTWGKLVQVGFAVLSGTALSAFYWLPALLERPAVYWQTAADRSIAAWHQLLPESMLAFPSLMDSNQINPPEIAALGVPVWGLAALSLVAVWVSHWRHTPRDPRPISRGEALQSRLVNFFQRLPAAHHEAFYFALVGLMLFVLAAPVAEGLWRAFPAWPPLYPYDLLPLIVVCWAIVAAQIGGLVGQMHHRAWSGVILVLLLVFVLVFALPFLPAVSWPDLPSSDILTVLRDETRGYIVASQVDGWLLPQDVFALPQLAPTLVASYEDQVVDKVARDHLPPAARVDIVAHSPQMERLVVSTADTVELTLLTFNFPGWKGRIDDRPVEIRSEPVTGLITLTVPEGYHEIEIQFGTTAPRSAAWVISSLAALAVVIVSARFETRWAHQKPETQAKEMIPALPLGALLLVALLFISLGMLPRVNPDWFMRHSLPGIVRHAQTQFPRTLQGVIDLLAYDIEPHTDLQAGDELQITLYWRAVRPDLPDYQSNLSLVAVDGSEQVIASAQHRHPGLIPISQWTLWPLLENYVRDSYYLKLDKNAPPGEYNIIIQLGRCSEFSLSACETITPLFVYDGRGSRLGQEIVLPVKIVVKQ